MKLHNIILSSILVFQTVNATIFNYRFYCVKDSNRICFQLNRKVADAVNSISQILGKKKKKIHLIIYIYLFLKKKKKKKKKNMVFIIYL